MKKRLVIVGAVIAGLFIVVLLVVFFRLNSMVKAGVENVLPRITGTPVKLEDVSISVFSGKGTLKGLVIGNPEGFNTEHAFALGTVRVDVDVLSVFSDKIIIEEVYIDGPEVIYEAGLRSSNIGEILDNVEEFAGPPKEGEAPEEGEKREAKKIQINHFVFKNGKLALSAKVLRGQKLSVPLPDVELHNIGSESGGKRVGEVAREIFVPLTRQIVNAAQEGVAQAKELIETARGTVEEATGKAKEAVEGVKETTKEAVDKVKDLFK